jgi:hypothetical protein
MRAFSMRRTSVSVVLLLTASSGAFGKGGGGGASATGGASGSSSAASSGAASTQPSAISGGLSGLSWERTSWESELTTPPGDNDQVLCFKLRLANNTIQPYVLEPRSELASPGTKVKCTAANVAAPLLMRKTLVVAIDVVDVPLTGIKLINLNVTNQQGASLNPSPVRPSLTTTATAQGNLSTRPIYFLRWPYEMPGDVIPTISVAVVYTPPFPGDLWKPDILYPAGALVSLPNDTGHYCVAVATGVSGLNPVGNPVQCPHATVATSSEKATALAWQESGPAPAGLTTAWAPNTGYQVGGLIVNGGRQFKATGAGFSGPTQPSFSKVAKGASVAELPTTLTWADAGATAPTGPGTPALWLPNTTYPTAAAIFDTLTGHYFVAMSAGVSGPGPAPPPFVVTPAPVDFQEVLSGGRVAEGSPPTIQWQLFDRNSVADWSKNNLYKAGALLRWADESGDWLFFRASSAGHSGDQIPKFSPGLSAGKDGTDGLTWTCVGPTPWKSNTKYNKGDVVTANPDNGHYYSVIVRGTTGGQQPDFPNSDGVPVVWRDAGNALTATVATAAQLSDETITLTTTTLSQVHSEFYFNLSAGVVATSIKSKTFGYSSDAGNEAIVTGSTHLIDPILSLTLYCVPSKCYPMDAESPWHPSDLIPAPTVAISLTSPASNFYFGGDIEIYRNVQIVGGAVLSKQSELASSDIYSPSLDTSKASPPTPTTVSKFEWGWFIGASFNFSGFIQSLFSGGGGGKGS